MSDGMNRVILLGNLGADPDLRYTPAGVPVLSLRLATNESFVDKNKEHQDRTEWHSVVVWGARGEALGKLLQKGACVCVEGALRTSSWEKDGQRRYRTEVYAREVFLTGRRPSPVGGSVESPRETSAIALTRAPAGSRQAADVADELPY
jgi:single-strand DNA-binding protein